MGRRYNFNIYGNYLGTKMKVIHWNSREELIENAILAIKTELQRKEGKWHGLMLSGGSTPLVIYQKIAKEPFFVSPNAVILYSDERFVPKTHVDSNYFQSKEMLSALKIKAQNIMRVQTELGHMESAEAYHNDLLGLTKAGCINLGFLGMGTDGHTASLFSTEEVNQDLNKMAIAVKRDKLPHRISVTKRFLNKCQKIILLIIGEEKQEILNVFLNNPDSIPAGVALKSHHYLEVWVSK